MAIFTFESIDNLSRKTFFVFSEAPPEIYDKRKKRNVSPLVHTDFIPSRILKVVYVVDQTFMTWYKQHTRPYVAHNYLEQYNLFGERDNGARTIWLFSK